MNSSLNIANHLILLASRDGFGVSIPLVEKLTYMAHATYFAENKEYLISEVPLVGEFGPYFAKLRSGVIPLGTCRAKWLLSDDPFNNFKAYEEKSDCVSSDPLDTLTEKEQVHIERVWSEAKSVAPYVQNDSGSELPCPLFSEMIRGSISFWNENFYMDRRGEMKPITDAQVLEILEFSLNEPEKANEPKKAVA